MYVDLSIRDLSISGSSLVVSPSGQPCGSVCSDTTTKEVAHTYRMTLGDDPERVQAHAGHGAVPCTGVSSECD